MKKHLGLFFSLISFFVCSEIIFAQGIQVNDSTKIYKWYEEPFRPHQPYSKNAKLLSLIQVRGNRFVNASGDTILFRGLSIADPDKIEGQGHWNKELFVRIKELGATLVRIPVHPIAWRERTAENYLKLLEQAVEWCTEEGLYVDIDWHSIGNLEEGLFQDRSYQTTLQETFNFWRTIAWHFSGHNTVAFFELFNEPADYNGRLGSLSWDQWKTINEHLIRLIRAYGGQTIPLVAGFDWAYDLTPLRYAPVNAEGIGYVTHPYAHKRTPPYELKWEEDFGFAAAKFPVLATELGFVLSNWQDNLDYGKAIIKYLEGRGIGWVWWVFDPEWKPNMFESWETFKLTGSGEFFKQAAHGEITK